MIHIKRSARDSYRACVWLKPSIPDWEKVRLRLRIKDMMGVNMMDWMTCQERCLDLSHVGIPFLWDFGAMSGGSVKVPVHVSPMVSLIPERSWSDSRCAQ